MKRRSLFFLTAIVSFVFGIASAGIWISKRSPTPPPITSSTDCTTVYDAAIVNTRIKDNDDPQFFAAFQEPPLYVMPDCVDEAYGLEWVPSFDGPVLVRIWRSQNRYFMVAKELDSKGWSKFGKIREANTRALTPFEWRSFTDLLLGIRFGRCLQPLTSLRQTTVPCGLSMAYGQRNIIGSGGAFPMIGSPG